MTTPDTSVNARTAFGLQQDLTVPAFSQATEHVPELDPNYCFDPTVTQAIVAGFMHNQRVLVQGWHGCGKSTHIEQVAARLNWPCVRVNLDGHISRSDLLGRDAIILQDGEPITRFQEGIIPWAMQLPVALCFDEYDAGRPEVMFTIQRMLEANGKLTMLDSNRVIEPHPGFRLFATTNTLGHGDSLGLYHGTHMLNQAQLDRWAIVATLGYPTASQELKILLGHCPEYDSDDGREQLKAMIEFSNMTRTGLKAGDVSTVATTRTLLLWAQNKQIFHDTELAFQFSFLNRTDETERPIFAEFYQRCFDVELPELGR